MVTGRGEDFYSKDRLYEIDAARLLLGRGVKTHDFTGYRSGTDYVFESLQNSLTGVMTAQGRRVKQGDVVVLKQENSTQRYRVEQIEYYASPSDMWIAQLRLLTRELG